MAAEETRAPGEVRGPVGVRLQGKTAPGHTEPPKLGSCPLGNRKPRKGLGRGRDTIRLAV